MNAREEKFAIVENTLGKAARKALEELYSLFDERVYLWVAELYDPCEGGFYYSTESKKYQRYLADVESTRQALTFISSSGLADTVGGKYADLLPQEVGKSIVRFVKGLEAPEGYFYHPQWGKLVRPSRKGRDLMWSRGILQAYGEEPPYPYATEQIKSGGTLDTLPEYITDRKLLWEYMESLDLNGDSYVKGQQLASQSEIIMAAGNADLEIRFLREKQIPENGLWEEGVTFNGVSGLLKLSSAHNTLKAPIPNIERTLESALAVAVSDEAPTSITGIYNPPNAISNLLTNLRLTGREELIPKLRARIAEQAADIILAVKRRLAPYKFEEDGSFSYFTYRAGHLSQGCPVAPRTQRCGDMNGVLLALGCITPLFEIIDMPKIPVYGAEDTEKFLSALAKAKPASHELPLPEIEEELFNKQDFR